MPSVTTSPDGQCPCAAATFAIDGPALFRVFCHCTICQAYNGAPYADVTAFRAADVHLHDEAASAFRAWKQPPIVQRGTCVSCEAPTIERIDAPVLPGLTMVATANIVDKDEILSPSMHIYYGSRVADVDDDLPKHTGGLSSQMAYAGALVRGMLRTRRAAVR